MSVEVIWISLAVAASGAVGGFVNVFIGDSGLHLPKKENDTFLPGFLGTVLVGAVAALGSWGATKAFQIFGMNPTPLSFTTADIASALMVGFGGAKWFKSEGEKDILQKTAAIAAGKSANPKAAAAIATGTPMQALVAAENMPD